MNVRPFSAVRPAAEYTDRVAALPYDVMNTEEARAYVEGNPYSFMRIDRAEINLPAGTSPYAEETYIKALDVYEQMLEDGVYKRDEKPYYYIYRLSADGRSQTGIVACPSVDEYLSGDIKKHELTRAEKEEDRVCHVTALDANTGPIFLAHKAHAGLEAVKARITGDTKPVFDFFADGGVRHEGWIISGEDDIRALRAAFADMDALYIADGHHRCASAVRVALAKREQEPEYTGEEEYNFFLAVCFPADELTIIDYNRVVKDLGGMDKAEFFERIGAAFEIEDSPVRVKPGKPKEYGLYLRGEGWYKLTARAGSYDAADPVASLDVSVLQDNLLAPILGIDDPRTSERIDFVGGIRGIAELERRVQSDMELAFALYPTSMEELMSVADAGLIMPPKSTWFEPKLLSGLFIHELTEVTEEQEVPSAFAGIGTFMLDAIDYVP